MRLQRALCGLGEHLTTVADGCVTDTPIELVGKRLRHRDENPAGRRYAGKRTRQKKSHLKSFPRFVS